MTLQCLRSGLWLERRHSGISSAQGLALEEHLAQCARCREQAERLDALRAVIGSAPAALSPRVRQRVIHKAIARGTAAAAATSANAHGAGTRWTLGSFGFAAVVCSGLAAAAAVAVWPERAPSSGPSKSPAPLERPPSKLPPASPAPAEPAPAPASPEAREQTQAAPARTHERPASIRAPGKVRRPEGVSASVHLRAARAALARGSVPEARVELERALHARPSRLEQAEERTLAAECALVSGERARAVALYRAVADRYRDLDAGENALFAAARVAQESGDTALGRRLLERYLKRHPRGRFRADAERRLAEASPP
jgi:hypothetical protein